MQKYQNTLLDNSTNAPLEGAVVSVFEKGTTTPVTIYAENDNTGTPIATLSTDALGKFEFFCEDQSVDLRFDYSDYDPIFWYDIEIYDQDEMAADIADLQSTSPDAPIVIRTQVTAATHTLVEDDLNSAVPINHATGCTVTVPPDSSVTSAIGTYVEFHQMGAGPITFAAGSGVTIRSSGGYLSTFGQYAIAALRKIAANEWLLTGELT